LRFSPAAARCRHQRARAAASFSRGRAQVYFAGATSSWREAIMRACKLTILAFEALPLIRPCAS
jgi:hypothetical protein